MDIKDMAPYMEIPLDELKKKMQMVEDKSVMNYIGVTLNVNTKKGIVEIPVDIDDEIVFKVNYIKISPVAEKPILTTSPFYILKHDEVNECTEIRVPITVVVCNSMTKRLLDKDGNIKTDFFINPLDDSMTLFEHADDIYYRSKQGVINVVTKNNIAENQ